MLSLVMTAVSLFVYFSLATLNLTISAKFKYDVNYGAPFGLYLRIKRHRLCVRIKTLDSKRFRVYLRIFNHFGTSVVM